MNVLAANEIKKHGVSAIESKLQQGHVHVLKHNRPLFVVLSEADYQALMSSKQKPSGLFAMLEKPVTGKLSKADIDKQFKQDRDDWQS